MSVTSVIAVPTRSDQVRLAICSTVLSSFQVLGGANAKQVGLTCLDCLQHLTTAVKAQALLGHKRGFAPPDKSGLHENSIGLKS
jgi:hypothetical protein